MAAGICNEQATPPAAKRTSQVAAFIYFRLLKAFCCREATTDNSQGQSPWYRDGTEFRPEGTVEMARNRELKVHRPSGTKPI
jgi:hypothetical protein